MHAETRSSFLIQFLQKHLKTYSAWVKRPLTIRQRQEMRQKADGQTTKPPSKG